MPFDRSRLDDIVEYLGRDTAAEMIGKARDGLDSNMRELRDVADRAVATRLAHTIKGLAAMYGLDELAAAALSIETATAGEAGLAELDRLVIEANRDLSGFIRDLTGSR